MTQDLVDLIERARDGDPDAGRELADILADAIKMPGRSVGAALMPKQRGGDYAAESRSDRNRGYEKYVVARFGTPRPTPNQAKIAAREVKRLMKEAHLLESPSSPEKAAARQIMVAGVGPVGGKHLYRLLNEPKKS